MLCFHASLPKLLSFLNLILFIDIKFTFIFLCDTTSMAIVFYTKYQNFISKIECSDSANETQLIKQGACRRQKIQRWELRMTGILA